MLNKPKIAALVHIYYHGQIDYIISKLKNIADFDFDLYVTFSKNFEKEKEKFLKFKKDTKFFQVSNSGYDIWPFIYLLKQINLDNYDYILKLHTKNIKRKAGAHWRNSLINPILGSKEAFKNCIKIFEQNNKTGLIGAKNCLSNMNLNCPENRIFYEEVCARFNLVPKKINFIAGTMFICRAELLNFFKTADIKEEDFLTSSKMKSFGTFAHVLERIFALVVISEGYEIYGADECISFLSFRQFQKIIQKIFLIKNEKMHKTINILGLKFKVRRYAYDIKGNYNLISIMNENGISDKLRKRKIKGLKIKIKGDCNTIRISSNSKFKNCEIEILSGQNEIIIEENTNLQNMKIKMTDKSNKKFKISKGTTVQNLNLELNKENISLSTKEKETINSNELLYNTL